MTRSIDSWNKEVKSRNNKGQSHWKYSINSIRRNSQGMCGYREYNKSKIGRNSKKDSYLNVRSCSCKKESSMAN